jgi:outer membrane receptor for ferrienterochelin and colicins
MNILRPPFPHVLLCLCLFLSVHTVFARDCSSNEEISDLMTLTIEQLMQIEIAAVSKVNENLHTAPGVASIISREEINRFGGHSLYEILERVAGVYMGGSILYPRNNAVIRGDQVNGLDRRVLVLLNGRPFRDALNGGINYPLYNAFPVAAIERLEIIRGPGSVLYGTNAYSGVINIITRNTLSNECVDQELEIGVSGGSFGHRAVNGHFTRLNEDDYLALGLSYVDEDGWDFNAIDLQGQMDSRKMGRRDLGLSLNAGYSGLEFNLALLKSTQNFIGTSMLWTPPTEISITRLLGDLGYRLDLSPERKLNFNLTYNLNDMLSESPIASNFSLSSKTHSVLLEANQHWQTEKLTWLLGTSLEYAWNGKMRTWTEAGEVPERQPSYHDLIALFYTQFDYTFDRTRLTIGGQMVKNPKQNWYFVPRLGLSHEITPNFSAKLLYSEAYRAATQVERNVQLPALQGTPDLAPEKVGTFDAQLFYHQDQGQISLTYFRSQQKDLITRGLLPGESRRRHFNLGSLTLHGIELDGKFSPEERWFITGSLTYQINKDGDGIKNYTLAPNWLFKYGVSYVFPSNLSLGLFHQYVSKMPGLEQRNPQLIQYNPEPSAYHLLSLNIDLPLGKKFGLSDDQDFVLNAYIYNLLDAEIYAPEINRENMSSVPAKSGRAAYAGFGMRF